MYDGSHGVWDNGTGDNAGLAAALTLMSTAPMVSRLQSIGGHITKRVQICRTVRAVERLCLVAIFRLSIDGFLQRKRRVAVSTAMARRGREVTHIKVVVGDTAGSWTNKSVSFREHRPTPTEAFVRGKALTLRGPRQPACRPALQDMIRHQTGPFRSGSSAPRNKPKQTATYHPV